jgi:glycine oxidase
VTPTSTPGHDQPLLILGGGLIGLAIAHELARRGRAVTVLSRRRSEAAGFVAAGMLAPHAEGLVGPLLELGQASLERIPAWVERIETDSGLSCGLLSSGIVVPFTNADERDAYPTAAWGVPLDRRGLEQEVAGLAPGWQAGLLFPQDGQIDNRRRLMRALERACVHRGVHFEEGCEVLELVTAKRGRAGDSASAGPAPADRELQSRPGPQGDVLQQDGRLVAVLLRRADGEEVPLPCSEAVLCCGAWSAALLPGLPLVPVKGQMLSLQGPIGALRRVLFGPGTYLVPREDGLVVVGATSEPEAAFGEGLTPSGQRQLQAGLSALLPEASGWPPMERWWGFRPCTPDQAPLLGAGPHEGLWLATGHHRNGVLLAAITAELLGTVLVPAAAAIEAGRDTGDRASNWLQVFGWGRFSPRGCP